MASAQDISIPLTLEEMVTIFRQEVDDLPGDTVTDVNWKNDDTGLLWSNQEAVRYANRALNEYCVRNPIHDSNTQQTITHIAYAADTQKGTLSDKILAIKRAKFVATASGDEQILLKRTHGWMDHFVPDWALEGNASTPGTPEFYIEDLDLRSIMLYPLPDVAGTVHLTVGRMPFKQMGWTLRHLDSPEIDEEHHFDLIDHMVYQAYQKRDAETENPELSAAALDRFTANVGVRPDARLLRVRREERNLSRRARAQYF